MGSGSEEDVTEATSLPLRAARRGQIRGGHLRLRSTDAGMHSAAAEPARDTAPPDEGRARDIVEYTPDQNGRHPGVVPEIPEEREKSLVRAGKARLSSR
ncbi:hypothetical protein JCM3263A_13750 [Thermobifida fusca]